MNYKKFAEKYAVEINGDFSDYDDEQSVIVIQLKDERYQAVQGRVFTPDKYGVEVLQLRSTVCKTTQKIDFVSLLEATTKYVYSKFVIEDDHLKVEASAITQNLSESTIKDMIQEAGNLADEWEFKITGKDIF